MLCFFFVSFVPLLLTLAISKLYPTGIQSFFGLSWLIINCILAYN